LDIDPNIEFDPQNYFDERFLHDSIEKGRLINTDLGRVALGVLYKAKEMLKENKPILLADILTDYLQIFRPDDFILKKKFRIA